MSDYWKSLPRKYCDICKCWFADNRASIEFHEKGKNHQENVKKRITEIQKKGLKEYKEKKKLDDQMEKIERAALAAFKKDVEQNPELAAKYNLTLQTPAAKPVQDSEVKNNSKPVTKKSRAKEAKSVTSIGTVKEERVWYEAKTDEGHFYYWNTVTSESRWEPPEEGFISLQEQEEFNAAEQTSEASDKTSSGEQPNDPCEEPSSVIGPQMKPDPYGSWVPVEQKVEEVIDWQLPDKPDSVTEVYIPLTKEDTLKMKEKTIGHLSDEFSPAESIFKKRKNLGNAKRNMRQRIDEDG